MIIFDTETTGLLGPDGLPDEQQPAMIEFAGIKVDDNFQEVDRREWLINPWGSGRTGELPPAITKVTGIKSQQLFKQLDFAGVYPQLVDFFLGERAMLAHNCPFDRDVLAYNLGRIGKRLCFPWPQEHICTVQATIHIKNKRLKLADLHAMAFGKPHTGAHRAMADVEALVRVCVWLRGEGLL